MQDQVISLANLFRAFSGGDNWTGINAKTALEDITPAEAVGRVNGSPMNIAEITAHLTCWNIVIAKRLEGGNYRPKPEENLPQIEKISEGEWEKSKQLFFDSIALLNEKLLVKTDDKLYLPMFEGATSSYRNVYGQLNHLHYHLGQIVLLKKILRG